MKAAQRMFESLEPKTWLRADAVYSMLTLAGATVRELVTICDSDPRNTCECAFCFSSSLQDFTMQCL